MFSEPTKVDVEREGAKEKISRKKDIQTRSSPNGYVSATTHQLSKNVCTHPLADITVIILVALHLGNSKSI